MLSTPARKMQGKAKTTETLVEGTGELSPCGEREAMSGTRYVQSAFSTTYHRGIPQFPWVWILSAKSYPVKFSPTCRHGTNNPLPFNVPRAL